MKVSVIIPTYNRSSVLKRVVDAVLSQTYRDLEVIVIDDGSTDDTGSVIAGIGDPRLVYRRIPNSGRPATPRNVGLGIAQGELIAFCDDDDLWAGDKLQRQVDFLEKNPSYGLVCSNAEGFPGEGGLEITLDGLLKVNAIIISSVLAKRRVLDAAGRFDEDMRLKAVEDFDFWVRVLHLSGTKAYRLPERLLHYNRETVGIGRSGSLQGRKTTYRKVIRVLAKAEKLPGLEARARAARRYQVRSLISTLQYFRYRRTPGFLLHLWKSACLTGTKVKLTLRWAGVPVRSMADADFWSRPASPGTGSPSRTSPVNAPRRIVVYDDSYAFGGHELMLCRLLRHLRESVDFRTLALFSYENHGYFQEQGFVEGHDGFLEIRFLPFSNPRRLGNIAALFSFRRILKIAATFRRFRPAAVLVAQGGIDTCTIGTLAARLCRLRTLSYIPNLNGYTRTHPSAKNRLRDRINGLFYRLPREFAVVRQGQEAELRAHGFKGPVHVIYNGMDFSPLRKLERAAARRELGLPEAGYWIGMVGRIDLDNKGQDLLLKAMAAHPESFEGARLLFVGDGPDLARLESQIESAGLRDRCAVLPFRKELSAVYSSLDLLAIPSKSEGMPLVMIEAMIMEIPVIASAIDGMLEMLPSDWLFPSGDAAGLAQRVGELRSRTQADRVEENRRLVETRFTEDRFLDSFRQFLK